MQLTFLLPSYVGQFLKIGWKMVMFGDETWLKLFPGLFTRHDGVGSFFVSLLYDFLVEYVLFWSKLS